MPIDNAKPGIGAVPEFMVSSHPWVTSSTVQGVVRHDFPYVTKFVLIKNNSTGSYPVKVGFTARGVEGSNYVSVAPGETLTADLKLKSIWISGSSVEYSILAGLTGIEARELFAVTGSLYDGVG